VEIELWIGFCLEVDGQMIKLLIELPEGLICFMVVRLVSYRSKKIFVLIFKISAVGNSHTNTDTVSDPYPISNAHSITNSNAFSHSFAYAFSYSFSSPSSSS
jgi:hypothetical protein